MLPSQECWRRQPQPQSMNGVCASFHTKTFQWFWLSQDFLHLRFTSIPEEGEIQLFRKKRGKKESQQLNSFVFQVFGPTKFFTKQTTFFTRKTEQKEFIWDQHTAFPLEICAKLSLEKELHLSCFLWLYGSQIKPSLPPRNVSQGLSLAHHSELGRRGGNSNLSFYSNKKWSKNPFQILWIFRQHINTF